MNEIVLQQPPLVPKMPPRVQRNKIELDKLLATKGIKSEWPPIWEQLPGMVIQFLPPAAYNPTITRHNGKLILAYRYHPDTTFTSKIGISEMDDRFRVLNNQQLDLNDDSGCEDPRFFNFNGDLWMSYVHSTYPSFPATHVRCCKITKIDKWRASDFFEWHAPDRQTMEKNWLYFQEHGSNSLHLIYKHNVPQDGDVNNLCQVVFTPADKREMKTPALRWPYGEIRGGTTPLPYQGNLITFFHSALFNEMAPVNLRYYLGSAILKAERPFQMLQVSKRPIVRGSEIGGDESKNFFKRNVVFACGAAEHDGGWAVSCGINDSAAAIIFVKPENLNL